MRYEQIIYLSKENIDKYNKWFDLSPDDFLKNNYVTNCTALIFSVDFPNGYEAEIKICTSDVGFFINPLLFDNKGREVCCLDCEYEIDQEYIFTDTYENPFFDENSDDENPINENEYVVIIKEQKEEQGEY